MHFTFIPVFRWIPVIPSPVSDSILAATGQSGRRQSERRRRVDNSIDDSRLHARRLDRQPRLQETRNLTTPAFTPRVGCGGESRTFKRVGEIMGRAPEARFRDRAAGRRLRDILSLYHLLPPSTCIHLSCLGSEQPHGSHVLSHVPK